MLALAACAPALAQDPHQLQIDDTGKVLPEHQQHHAKKGDKISWKRQSGANKTWYVKFTGASPCAEGKQFGNLTLTANTTAADHLNFALRSNLAGSSINGSGTAQMSGDYPVNANLSFQNITWSKLAPLVGPSTGASPPFDGVVDGEVAVNGPALDTDKLRGSMNLSRLNITSLPRPGSG